MRILARHRERIIVLHAEDDTQVLAEGPQALHKDLKVEIGHKDKPEANKIRLKNPINRTSSIWDKGLATETDNLRQSITQVIDMEARPGRATHNPA